MKAKALSAVATVLLLAVMAAALPFSVPKLFGYQIYNVLTQSMEPAMPVGSAIYVKRCDRYHHLPAQRGHRPCGNAPGGGKRHAGAAADHKG